ncbi:MAG TPA: GNAT family N-acetyltransferase [Micromonosporaceae bacterium]|jgi:GNAT superfamily N-acetyltransferase
MPVTVRQGTAADSRAMAELRWRDSIEGGRAPAGDRDSYVASFATWVGEHTSTHRPFVAEMDGEVVGMAWLMVSARVPSPANPHRLFGDVQSVYVASEVRNDGIGAALLTELLAEAARLGLEHVTVHASNRAVPLYQRVGFGQDRCWLRWQPE